ECLPAFAAIICVAHLSGQGQITDPLALWALAARLTQSSIHLISTRNRAVIMRFSMLMVQWVIEAYWLARLINV
ncbi:MAG: MAPEG family protein, partial [Brachymonas sp.]